MKKFILSLLIGFSVAFVYGQNRTTDANIVGHVQSNGKHIPFINVFIKGTTIGTTTDHTGHYQLINVPEGEHVLVARGVGYKTSEARVNTKLNTTEEVKFELSEDILNLEDVVVTADRHGISRREAPVIVNTVTPKLFESAQAISIAAGLDFVPGLRMECNCQNCGFSQVRMNGLDGPYSQILINSRPVFSGLAGVYGLELIPASMVDRIEVVRGGGSALFGGNAIAGTINIITREPISNSFNVEGRFGSIGFVNDHGTEAAFEKVLNLNGSLVTDDLKSGLSYFGMLHDRDPFDENGDGYSELVSLKNTTFGINAFHKISDRSKLSMDLYRINEFRRGGNKFDYLPHEADIAELVDHLITGTGITFDHFTNKSKMNKLTIYAAGQTVGRDSYYGAEQDPDAYGRTDDLTTSIGGQYYMHLSQNSTLMVGIDDNLNKLTDTKLGSGGDPNRDIVNQLSNVLGTFSQYELHSGIFRFSLGLRYDRYLIRDLKTSEDSAPHEDVSGGVFAPRLNFLFDLTPSLQLRTAYSKGYRAPQIFDEDLHIESSGSQRVLHANADNLKQENSHSITSSLRHTGEIGNIHTEFLVEGFYTRLIDPFSFDYEFTDSTKTLLMIRNNSEEGAFVGGVNLELNAAFSKQLSLQIGYTQQISRFDSPQPWGDNEFERTKRFLRAPDSYGFMTLDWHPTDRLDISLTANYTGSMYVPHFGLSEITSEEWELINSGNRDLIDAGRQKEIEAILNGDVIEGERLEKTEQFLIFGLRLAYEIPLTQEANLQIYTGVQNLFNQTQKEHDRGVFRDAGYIYGPCQPTTLNFGVKYGNLW